jgi:hypothetical protein
MKIRLVRAEFFDANRQADRQTDMTKIIVVLRDLKLSPLCE